MLKCSFLFEILISISLEKYPEVILLSHMVVLFSRLLETSILFSIKARPIYIYQQCTKVAFSFHPCPRLLSLFSFLIIDILTALRQHVIVALMCISQLINGAEHVFHRPYSQVYESAFTVPGKLDRKIKTDFKNIRWIFFFR